MRSLRFEVDASHLEALIIKNYEFSFCHLDFIEDLYMLKILGRGRE